MGGMRSVQLWTDKPKFDQRAFHLEYEIFHTTTQSYGAGVYRENGWTSVAGFVRAKSFLKQSDEIMCRVSDMMIDSITSELLTSQQARELEAGDLMLDVGYEARCAISWKRFLLEIDLKNDSVRHVDAMVIMPNEYGGGSIDYPLTPELCVASHFLDEDLSKPFRPYERLIDMELRTDRIW